jgi:hypothetical protein
LQPIRSSRWCIKNDISSSSSSSPMYKIRSLSLRNCDERRRRRRSMERTDDNGLTHQDEKATSGGDTPVQIPPRKLSLSPSPPSSRPSLQSGRQLSRQPSREISKGYSIKKLCPFLPKSTDDSDIVPPSGNAFPPYVSDDDDKEEDHQPLLRMPRRKPSKGPSHLVSATTGSSVNHHYQQDETRRNLVSCGTDGEMAVVSSGTSSVTGCRPKLTSQRSSKASIHENPSSTPDTNEMSTDETESHDFSAIDSQASEDVHDPSDQPLEVVRLRASCTPPTPLSTKKSPRKSPRSVFDFFARRTKSVRRVRGSRKTKKGLATVSK